MKKIKPLFLSTFFVLAGNQPLYAGEFGVLYNPDGTYKEVNREELHENLEAPTPAKYYQDGEVQNGKALSFEEAVQAHQKPHLVITSGKPHLDGMTPQEKSLEVPDDINRRALDTHAVMSMRDAFLRCDKNSDKKLTKDEVHLCDEPRLFSYSQGWNKLRGKTLTIEDVISNSTAWAVEVLKLAKESEKPSFKRKFKVPADVARNFMVSMDMISLNKIEAHPNYIPTPAEVSYSYQVGYGVVIKESAIQISK